MTDRELLGAAAKVAGVPLRMLDAGMCGTNDTWNPLTDDGDALRLAMHLGMRVSVRQADADGGAIREVGADLDAMAATRRAIVRAAAAIADVSRIGAA